MVTVPLPVQYGPVPEEEECAAMRSDDAPAVLVKAQVPDGEASQPDPSRSPQETCCVGEPPVLANAASEAKAQVGTQLQPYLHQHQQPHAQTSGSTLAAAAKGPHVSSQPSAEGGHINLAFSQGQQPEQEGQNGRSTTLWNPTYGSWFLQQRKQKQQRQAGVGAAGGGGSSRVPGEGQEHMGRTVAEVAGALGIQHQHKQFQHQLQQQHHLQLLHQKQQQQQQQGLCRPLLPPPPPPTVQSPLLLDTATLAPVPLYRLRRFPCGNIGYGYQEAGVTLDTSHANPVPPPPAPGAQQGASSAAHPRGPPIGTSLSVSRSVMPEDSRPLLVTMGTVQDPRLPRMEGHNATVL